MFLIQIKRRESQLDLIRGLAVGFWRRGTYPDARTCTRAPMLAGVGAIAPLLAV